MNNHNHGSELRTSAFDQVSGLLVAVLMLFGSITLLMFIVWLTNRLIFVPKAVPVVMLEDVGGGGGGGSGEAGPEQPPDEPPPEETKELTETPPEQALLMLSQIVNVEVELMDETAQRARGSGQGTGMGDGRGAGPGGPGTSDGIPAWERWELRMSATNLNEYAAQLEFFKIELGVAGGGNPKVDYITGLTRVKPIVRVGDPKDEKRLRFMHRSGALREADRQLAEKAGVKTQGRVVFQFYSPEMYQQLLTLENQKKGMRPIRDIRRTVFGVTGTAGRYQFVVLEQDYRSGA